MHSSVSHIVMIKNTQQIQKPISIYSIIIVFCLFTLHLLITPLTFTSIWHCPMMDEPSSVQASADMPCMHMASHNMPKKAHTQHSMMICPLCSALALPSPLLGTGSVLPFLTIVVLSFQHKTYQAQAPPVVITDTILPRAPPTL